MTLKSLNKELTLNQTNENFPTSSQQHIEDNSFRHKNYENYEQTNKLIHTATRKDNIQETKQQKPYKTTVTTDRFGNRVKLHQCDYCEHVTKDSGNMNKHIRTHTGETPFKCSMCDFSCKQKHSLARHIRNIHLKNSDDSNT